MVFGFKKKRDTIDFTKMPGVSAPQQNVSNLKMSGDCVDLSESNLSPVQASGSSSGESSGGFDFLNTMASSSSSSSLPSSSNVVTQISEVADLKNKLRNFTGKIEELSNENYHLMQRIELLERKIERMGG